MRDLVFVVVCVGIKRVLNLTVAMVIKILTAFLLVMLNHSGFVLPENLSINYPGNNVSIRGVVEIRGTVISDSFSSAAVYFSYSNSTSENWFLISRIDQPVENGLIARWDTTTITDGEYKLKLVLTKTDGSDEEVIISPLFVRNYTAEPTVAATPTVVVTEENLTSAPTSGNPLIYATQLPRNPASTSEQDLSKAVFWGVGFCILILTGLFLYGFFNGRNRLL
jgi:hypothetical protein